MESTDPKQPSEAVIADREADKAPDPRRHYDSPEDLFEDINLDLETREALLREWKDDLDRQLESEAEGMSAQDPISANRESQLAAEVRRVTKALTRAIEDRSRANKAG